MRSTKISAAERPVARQKPQKVRAKWAAWSTPRPGSPPHCDCLKSELLLLPLLLLPWLPQGPPPPLPPAPLSAMRVRASMRRRLRKRWKCFITAGQMRTDL